MKLKKFFLLIIVLISFNAFAFANDLQTLLKQALDNLQSTTVLLQEQQSLNSVLEKKISDLEMENKKLRENLQKAETALSNSNITLKEALDRIKEDQDEIIKLRSKLNIAINNIQEQKYFGAGLGISYPMGGTALFEFYIPQTRLFVFGNANLQTTLNYALTAGIGYKF